MPINGFLTFVVIFLCPKQETGIYRSQFPNGEPGKPPIGWIVAQTGKGNGSVWSIIKDPTAKNISGVLAQTAESPGGVFNLCLAKDTHFKNPEISVRFKAVAGKSDQGGGIVWRYSDSNNYYLARFNPLEQNFRLYKVVKGSRVLLATRENLAGPVGEWHTMTVRMMDNKIACLLNGKKEMDFVDETFEQAGMVGLWTKADAQTRFDEFWAKEIK